MIKVGIIGATGYTGLELLRLIKLHPYAKIYCAGVRYPDNRAISTLFPNFRGYYDNLTFTNIDDKSFFDCDVIFFAAPQGVAMNMATKFVKKGIKVIDLSADFRIKNHKIWSKFYNLEHNSLSLLQDAVYGLVEIYEADIKKASLVANPGCYPTAVLLSILPLLKDDFIKSTIIADCKSGISGAGKQPKPHNIITAASENTNAYGVGSHRHQPEILAQMHNFNSKLNLIFTPHLVPMKRGMLATVYAEIANDIDALNLFQNYYKDNNAVMIITDQVQTKFVVGTNNTHISVSQQDNNVIITTAIDNLIKGASGQAVQNMNLMFGYDKNLGLTNIAINP